MNQTNNQNQNVRPNPNQNVQPNQNPQLIKERLLDIESLLLVLESDPDLQPHHQRIFRMIHNLIKELILKTDS